MIAAYSTNASVATLLHWFTHSRRVLGWREGVVSVVDEGAIWPDN